MYAIRSYYDFECGKRELLEETAAIASDYRYLGVMYPTTAYLSYNFV